MSSSSSQDLLHAGRRITALTAVLLGTSTALAPTAAAQGSLESLPGINQLGSLFGQNDSTGERSLTVTPKDDLTDGATITVKGVGYPAGENIYLAQTIEQPAGSYPENYAEDSAQKVTVSEDGTFEQEMTVATAFNDIDCTSTQCYVASFTAFPKLADRSNDAWIPIDFQGGAPGPAQGSSSESPNRGSSTSNSGLPTTGESTNLGSTSASGASVNLSKTDNLNPDGDTITVTGSGFKTSGQGIYVGIAQNDQADFANADTFSPDTVWVSKSKGNLNSDGSFSISLPVKALFGSANCLENACSVYTMAAHGSADRSQDTATPVSFAGGVAKQAAATPKAADGSASGTGSSGSSGTSGSNGASSAAGSRAGAATPASSSSNGAVSVQLSTTELQPEGTTPITVTGTGFKTTGNGVYVVVGERAKYSTTNAENFSAQTWIEPAMMSSDGSWSTTLNVDPATSAANCLENQCALFTFAAHGSSDRSQDTATDLTVAGTAEQKAAAAKKAASRIAQDNQNKTSNQGTGSRTASTGSTDQEVAQASTNQQMNPLLAGGIGALFGAALFGAGSWFGRKRATEDARSTEEA